MFRTFFLLSIGLFGGLWIAWPGIARRDNWACALDIIISAKEDKVDMRAVMAVNPKYILEKNETGKLKKIRLVGDACFR
ncbi:hypothetical protein [Prochlorococcus sp. MIT 1223]|uniref:hypothetical protein n=1 Tax=Prochlorococcus sp. MIT 1223 TaxID=3096217 RepID=UPI002A74F50D|nr:hypothetical protein [Prochlorococcus sp. MIT 1223]